MTFFGLSELFNCNNATILFLLVVFTHYFLSLPPYPPIFGVYRQKSFAFYVKKYVMRILLKFQKRKPINDDEADKLQPLSSHPLVCISVFPTQSERIHMDIAGIRRGLFQYELFKWRNPSILNGSTKERTDEYDGILEIARIPSEASSLAGIPWFMFISNSSGAKHREKLHRGGHQANAHRTNEQMATRISREDAPGKWFGEKLRRSDWCNLDGHITAFQLFHRHQFDRNERSGGSGTMEPQIFQRFEKVKPPWALSRVSYSSDCHSLANCSHHQTHFEQYGKVRGAVIIDGRFFPINTCGLRDHTFGWKRDWKQFHRYVIHFFQLENGDAITIGVVSVPVMFSR